MVALSRRVVWVTRWLDCCRCGTSLSFLSHAVGGRGNSSVADPCRKSACQRRNAVPQARQPSRHPQLRKCLPGTRGGPNSRFILCRQHAMEQHVPRYSLYSSRHRDELRDAQTIKRRRPESSSPPPTDQGCEGNLVRVAPFQKPCQEVASTLPQGSTLAETLSGTPLYNLANNQGRPSLSRQAISASSSLWRAWPGEDRSFSWSTRKTDKLEHKHAGQA